VSPLRPMSTPKSGPVKSIFMYPSVVRSVLISTAIFMHSNKSLRVLAAFRSGLATSLILTLASLTPSKPNKPLLGSSKTSTSISSFVKPSSIRAASIASSIVFALFTTSLIIGYVLLYYDW